MPAGQDSRMIERPDDETTTWVELFSTSSPSPAVASAPHEVSKTAVGSVRFQAELIETGLHKLFQTGPTRGIDKEEPRRSEEGVNGRTFEITQVV